MTAGKQTFLEDVSKRTGFDRIENGGVSGGPSGPAELGVSDTLAGRDFVPMGRSRRACADGFGEIVTTGRVVVDGIEDAGLALGCDVEEGAGGIVAVDEIDEGVGGTERKGLAGEGGFDEAGPARAVDTTETEGGATCLRGKLLGLEQDVAGRRAAGRG